MGFKALRLGWIGFCLPEHGARRIMHVLGRKRVPGDLKSTEAVTTTAPQLPVLRFSLRHLFWWLTGASVLFAALVLSPRLDLSPLAVLLFSSLVALHVIGTALGTRLRAHANELRAWEATQATAEGPPRPALARIPVAMGPRSPLHGHHRPLRRLPQCLAAGAMAGGILGVVVLSLAIGDRSSLAGVAVGSVSMAVVGAWLAFVGVSAWSIMREGWRDAVAGSQVDYRGGTKQS